MKRLPLARNNDLVVQMIDKELLIYDLQNNKALCLNETAKLVFHACDGKTGFDELLKKNPQLNKGIIQLTLEKLSQENLLTEKFESGIPRREMLQKAALTAIALPIISTVIVPINVDAQSCNGLGNGCSVIGECCPGLGCQDAGMIGIVVCCTPPGGNCTFPRPDLCCSGCCISAPSGPVCCT